MKVKSIIAGLVTVLSLAFVTSRAQQGSEPAVKILPTLQPGIVKILYAYETDKPVEVRFVDEGGLITRDKVTIEKGLHGFSKRYNIHNIDAKIFWIEISSENVSVTYRMMESKDTKSYVPFLEKATYSYPLVASK